MNTLTLIVLWLVFYPVACEVIMLLIAIRRELLGWKDFTQTDYYRLGKLQMFIYFAVIIYLLWE
jgi:hypothetical protein